MQILIMGAGAVGGCLGGLLANSGHEVTLVARGKTLKLIRQNGLVLKHGEKELTMTNLNITDSANDVTPVDLVLFCVKAYQTDLAMKVMKNAVSENTTIITLQNGIGSHQKLIEEFEDGKVLQGLIYVEAEQLSPGIVTFHGAYPKIIFGGTNLNDFSQLNMINQVLNDSKIQSFISDDIQRDAWHKLIFISALSGLTCVTRATFSEVIHNPKTAELVHAVLEETALVARTAGVNIDSNIVRDTLRELEENSENLVSSMYADLQNAKPIEIDVITGEIYRTARRMGVETPVNDFIFSCLSIYDQRARENYDF